MPTITNEPDKPGVERKVAKSPAVAEKPRSIFQPVWSRVTKVWDKSKSFLGFFSGYLWGGITLLLIGIILDQAYGDEIPFVAGVLTDICRSLGVAVIIAAIFSYTVGTARFIDRVREDLQSIIASRRFLSDMDHQSKRDVLRAVLTPTERQRRIYDNVDSYYEHFIEKSLGISNTCVRSNYRLSCKCFYDLDLNCVVCEQTINYRLYPASGGYEDVVLTSVGPDEHKVCVEHLKFFYPKGDPEIFKASDIAARQSELRAQMGTGEQGEDTMLKIPVCNPRARADWTLDPPHVDVEMKVVVSGDDHWINLAFKALQPTDGFRFSVQCEGMLVIRDYNVLIHSADFRVDPAKPAGSKQVVINCPQWMDQGAGVAVIVGVPHAAADEIKKQMRSAAGHALAEELAEHLRVS
ncbi:hypothetical protein [Alienimonas chondri]|uniref:Uncharacterized protein n=1 Tax=Alienimonas chondri TaxID=2681879 RepID=A0ABX1VIH2_9PLAN|nr:hypothetical protein [Alienimonas chondri]NNJ27320.1 hypothetical protein [Alienimonas chondri]